jgi:hypothetical protein
VPDLQARLRTGDIGFYARTALVQPREGPRSEVAQDTNEPEYSRATLRPFCYLAHLESAKKDGTQTRRALEMLNTPLAVLAAVVVIVALNGFLFFGYYLPRTTAPPASPPQGERTTTLEETTVERIRPTTTVEEARPEETTATPTVTATTATPTATATSSP